MNTSTSSYLQSFMNGIAESANTSHISTGFEKLDEVLGGGLYEGLYVVGAISSLGKTTLLTQISDHIAQSGQHVLFFSLEMARSEIMSKSISRHTLQNVLADGGVPRFAKTSRDITTSTRYSSYSSDEIALIDKSVRSYGQYAQNIYINECVDHIGTQQIRQTVRDHVLYTGKTPVVIIDYLQILAPHTLGANDKQNMDNTVMELKRISRDYKTPVIGISSFNRSSYKDAVTMEAFKESGAIEYSSDVLIGLQFKGSGKKDFDVNNAKREDPREIECVMLKSRNGSIGDIISFDFYPMFNFFREA